MLTGQYCEQNMQNTKTKVLNQGTFFMIIHCFLKVLQASRDILVYDWLAWKTDFVVRQNMSRWRKVIVMSQMIKHNSTQLLKLISGDSTCFSTNKRKYLSLDQISVECNHNGKQASGINNPVTESICLFRLVCPSTFSSHSPCSSSCWLRSFLQHLLLCLYWGNSFFSPWY